MRINNSINSNNYCEHKKGFLIDVIMHSADHYLNVFLCHHCHNIVLDIETSTHNQMNYICQKYMKELNENDKLEIKNNLKHGMEKSLIKFKMQNNIKDYIFFKFAYELIYDSEFIKIIENLNLPPTITLNDYDVELHELKMP